ncbi:hypothetical protein D3C85_1633700 [compost metagenome]
MARVVEQVVIARFFRDPEVTILLVPTLVLGDCLGSGTAHASLHLLANHFLITLIEHVGTALKEQHPENVFLELRGVHFSAQDVGGFEQVAL